MGSHRMESTPVQVEPVVVIAAVVVAAVAVAELGPQVEGEVGVIALIVVEQGSEVWLV